VDFCFLSLFYFHPCSSLCHTIPLQTLKFGLICWIHIAHYKTHACNPKKKSYQNTTHSSLCTHIPTSKFKPTEIWFCKWFSQQGYTTYENSEPYWHYVILPSFIRLANQNQSAHLWHDKKCSHHQQQFSYRFAQLIIKNLSMISNSNYLYNYFHFIKEWFHINWTKQDHSHICESIMPLMWNLSKNYLPIPQFLLHKHFPSIATQLLQTIETSTTWNSNKLCYNVAKKTQCWIEPALPVFHILWSIVIDSNPNRYS